MKIYPFQQFEISSLVEDLAGISVPLVHLHACTAGAAIARLGRIGISNVKLPCSRGDTAIKTRRIVRRINMSISDRSSTSFIVATSGVETGINDTTLPTTDSIGSERMENGNL